jgi:hypothetical protein
MKDMKNKNRQSKGDTHHSSKLTTNKINEMLNNIENGYFKTVKEISDYYKINNASIYDILNNKLWTHVTKNHNLFELKQLLSISTKQQFFGENSPNNKLDNTISDEDRKTVTKEIIDRLDAIIKILYDLREYGSKEPVKKKVEYLLNAGLDNKTISKILEIDYLNELELLVIEYINFKQCKLPAAGACRAASIASLRCLQLGLLG